MPHGTCKWERSSAVVRAASAGRREPIAPGRGRGSSRVRRAAWAGALLGLALPGVAVAQRGVIGRDPLDRLQQERPTLPPFQAATPTPALSLPPPPAPPAGAEGRLPTNVRVFVRRIETTGNTVFSAQQLAPVIAPYLDRKLSFEDLEELRQALTLLYVRHGYVNSGAVIPDQEVRDGVVTMRIVEGRLKRIEVEGNRWLRAGWVKDRLAAASTGPLNVEDLQRALQLLQQNPRIARINAELRPGLRRGEAVLAVRIEEAVPYRLRLEFNNYESPAIGSEHGVITAAHDDVLGFGDGLTFRYGITGGLDDYDVDYRIPVSARDTTIGFLMRRSDSLIIESPFDQLDIRSDTETYGVSVRQPFLRTLGRELALALSFEHRRSKTYLLGQPFTFALGAHDGESVVNVLRFSQEWTNRSPRRVIAARSQLSFGLDVLGATDNPDSIPDGSFFAWLLQAQWAELLTDWRAQLIGRVDLQLTPDPLLSLEQFAVGGSGTVRGYRENEIVRDNGAIGSLELRLPVLRSAQGVPILQIAPFGDVGSAWAAKGRTSDPKVLASLGLGLLWEITSSAHAQVYWGGRLTSVHTSGNDPQDEGVHFQIYWDLSPPRWLAERVEPWRPW